MPYKENDALNRGDWPIVGGISNAGWGSAIYNHKTRVPSPALAQISPRSDVLAGCGFVNTFPIGDDRRLSFRIAKSARS